MRESEPRHAAVPVPRGALAGQDPLSALLAEVEALEGMRRELEEGRDRLQGRIDAALVPLCERIVAARLELMRLCRRRLEGASRRLREDGESLVLGMAADLQERFGADVREFTDPGADPEEEDGGEDFGWARPGAGLPPPRPAARRVLDPQAAARGIYRSLARELHPDKAREAAEKERRTALMHALNEAWAARDLGALLSLLHAHGSGKAREGLDADALEACRLGLEERRAELERAVRELRHRRLPAGVTDWLPLVREEARFGKVLRRVCSPAREELAFLAEVRRAWLRPGGLEACLRDPPEGLA